MKLHSNMEGSKQVRVDNWGIFFLQRLQMFFSKTDYCDMTLQFEGNVQLKVHRLVMNACTEYFQFLEETCTSDENVIMMPADLQADVIVPIVNFMYTGMLEFQLNIFDKLYKTAQIMNITILTKLLDAQKQSMAKKRRHSDNLFNPPAKKTPKDLPAPLPGRKLPIWKRKSAPITADQRHHPTDPLLLTDNVPKPTRFEWPDDDLPPLNPMDASFEDISYTSKPLLTQEEEQRASTSFDDLRNIPNAVRTNKRHASPTLDFDDMKDYVKEQKIRSGLEEEKKKGKKVKFDETDKTTTISIDAKGQDLNHEKIVAELLKKYPQLVKKNKNIRLKIMAKNKEAKTETKPLKKSPEKAPSPPPPDVSSKPPWTCTRCSTESEPVEFVLYYLYRKHMTDVHHEKFDAKLCKYCGHRCSKNSLLMYHLYTKHGMRPPPGYNFPKCDQCPFIALSSASLTKHKLRHNKNEMQCMECRLAFTCQLTLTSHIQITGHTGKSTKNNYDCQYCTKRFQSGTNLFSHVKLAHRSEAIRDGIVSIDETDDAEEEEEDDEEYILPEIMPEQKKVNVLSNVKVQNPQLNLPSSEAEALNNVATGIATSLGLVDIVVLNDNQQIFLQDENFSEQSEQPEFILPELTGQSQNEVMTTDGVITQSMLGGGDIGSTDELVMVLTDHDYGDNQEEINNDNSNIVVLYSHPVDGQQDQFITSQGNLMVNSQGLLEIRNGALSASSTNQVAIEQQESHIESIEMIQREIESQRELKHETYEEEKPVVQKIQKEKESERLVISRDDPLLESLTQGEQIEFTSPLTANLTEERREETEEERALGEDKAEGERTEEQDKEQQQENAEKPQENEEGVQESESLQQNEENVQQAEPEIKEEAQQEAELEENRKDEEEPAAVQVNEEEKETTNEAMEIEESEQQPETAAPLEDQSKTVATETEEELMENDEEKELSQSDTSTSQFNDENSQSSQDKEEEEDRQTKMSILDDWDDTDSQQSDKEKAKVEEVHKLMDDWEEEEDEDDGKKEG